MKRRQAGLSPAEAESSSSIRAPEGNRLWSQAKGENAFSAFNKLVDEAAEQPLWATALNMQGSIPNLIYDAVSHVILIRIWKLVLEKKMENQVYI